MINRSNAIQDIHQAARLSGIEKNKIRFFEMQFRDVFRAAGIDLESRHYSERRLEVLKAIEHKMAVDRLTVAGARKALTDHYAGPRKALTVVAVTSGKGGVGKTTVSLNLAISLARLGLRTLLFDADLGLANVHVYAGIHPKGTLADVVSGRAKLEEVVSSGIANVSVVCGDSGVARMADLNQRFTEYLSRELERLAASYDIILVDTAAGISNQVIEFLRIADDMVVVTTPNIAATLDAYSVIKIVRQNRLSGRIHVLTNLVSSEAQSHEVFGKLRACSQKFLAYSPAYLGYLINDPFVEETNAKRQPLVVTRPTNTNAMLFRELASRLYAPHAGGGDAQQLEAGMAEAKAG